MEITLNKTDDLNGVINVNVTPDDYQEKVDKVLKDYRKKANIPGFRPGKVPMGYVKKMYGKAILVDEINKMLSESLVDYLKKEELNILGEPLPSQDSESIDFDNQKEFDFKFDVAFAPEFEVKLSKREKLNYYVLKPDEKLIDDTINNYAYQNGENVQVDEITEKEETLKGDIVQLDADNNPLEDGIKKENGLMSLQVMKDEDIKKQFEGKKVGDAVDFDLKKAYPNDTEIASLLEISKEDAAKVEGNFRITINEINKFTPAEVNQELYDKIYGEGTVTSDEQFREKIVEEIKENFKYQSEYKFMLDAKEKLIKKLDLDLPDEFLKRWLDATNKELTKEQIEEEYDKFKEDMQWQLIVDKIYKDNDFKVEESEVMDYAKESTRQQFMQYGLSYIPDEQLENYAKEIASKPEERRKILDKLAENKAVEFIKESVKVEEKEVSLDEFNNFFK
ncbi:Trigger factor [Salinivirga cyanobacteriivorans]|uniref:Trigger factor n=1 Tax=Salinivirga cyanobacteriivorans TaxID=1307839 RepID=A0A0S2HY48_9BACT|nr:trigger factor [Salinivirga cyanobacteriivorans]ALO14716.1 Trigger factor [Salinivirga cyanobacteriivorans]